MARSHPRQLLLFAPDHPGLPEIPRPPQEVAPESLESRLGRLMDGRLRSLTLTENRSRIISSRPARNGFAVRIHRCFARASEATLRSVADFVLGGRKSDKSRRALVDIRRHFEAHGPETAPRPRRQVLRTRGRCFDLAEIRDDLNARFFDDRLEVAVTWGRSSTRRRKRRGAGFSVRLGVYVHEDRLVRIHPTLDRPDVPRYVVESVVYHEMLHAAVPPIEGPNGRRSIHPPEFQRRERLFPRYQAAETWIQRHLGRLAGLD